MQTTKARLNQPHSSFKYQSTGDQFPLETQPFYGPVFKWYNLIPLGSICVRCDHMNTLLLDQVFKCCVIIGPSDYRNY